MTRVDRSRLPVPGPGGTFRFPVIQRTTLANGLDVRAITHRNVPVMSAVLMVRGGTASDPSDRPGLAAFTADLLDEGSGNHSALDIADLLARYGADLDVDVSADAMVVAITTLSRFTTPALALLAEMVRTPTIADSDVERVRKLRLERLRQLRDHAPAVAERAFLRELYGTHPYGHLSAGSEESIAVTLRGDLSGFHAAAFVPAACTAVIVGDADADALVAEVSRAFGDWQPSAEAIAIDRQTGMMPPPVRPPHRLVLVAREGAAQSEIRIGQVAASRQTPDYHALLLLNMVLGGQFVSRVNMNLRQDKGYTYGVRTGFELRRGRGPFALQTSVGTEVTAPAVTEAMRELTDIRTVRPPTATELDTARAAVTLGYPRNFETAQQVARSVSSLALHDLPDSYFEEFVPRVNAVTLADLSRVAEEYLDPSQMLTLVVGDIDRIKESLSSTHDEPPVVLAAS